MKRRHLHLYDIGIIPNRPKILEIECGIGKDPMEAVSLSILKSDAVIWVKKVLGDDEGYVRYKRNKRK